jgi:phospholipase C
MFQVCIRWVDRSVIECKMWAHQVDRTCTQWADEGSHQCSEWADEGHRECSKWGKECKWYKPWNCVIEWVCKGWYWVAKWVCKAWYWVAKWVCKVWTYLVRAVCVVFGWLVRTTCWLLDRIRCWVTALVVGIAGAVRRSSAERRAVDHVFVLILENRSYDHMLGAAGLRGTDAATGEETTADGADPALHSNVDPDPAGPVVVPFGTPAPFKIEGTTANDPGHEFGHNVRQLAGANAVYVPGAPYPPIDMSGFVAVHRERGADDPGSVMLGFTPRQLPVLTTLAREFCVCDRWFSSLPGPTWANRFFAVAASSGGLDASPSSLEVVLNTALDGYRFENGTVFDLLDGACLPWRVYHGDELPVSFALSGMTVNRIADRFDDMEDFTGDVADPDFDDAFVFIEPHYGNILPGTPEDYTCGTSQHPLDDVTRGEGLIKEVYEAIRNSPHWERSLLIVTWDEHGGFYDHVPPPAAVPPGDAVTDPDNNENGFDFSQLGPRVPAVVVSPFVERGTIDHAVYDHSSIAATVERIFGLDPMTARDAAAADVRSLLGRTTPRDDAPTTLPEPARSGWTCEGDDVDVEVEVQAERGPRLDGADGDESPPEPGAIVLAPAVAQALSLAAMGRIRRLGRWDAKGRRAVLDELAAIDGDHAARVFVHRGRRAMRGAAPRRAGSGTRYPRLSRVDAVDDSTEED